MADEKKPDEDATKELRAEFAKEIEALIRQDKYVDKLDIFFLQIDPETGAFGYGGTMCPVCATKGMMQAIMRFGIKHTNPEHEVAEQEAARAILSKIVGPMSIFADDDEDVTKH